MSKSSEVEVHVHSHGHSEFDVPISNKHKKIIWTTVIAVVLFAVVSVIFTWPSPSEVKAVTTEVSNNIDFASDVRPAVVDSSRVDVCPGQEDLDPQNQTQCLIVLFDVTDHEVSPLEGEFCENNQPYNENDELPIRYCVQQTFEPEGATTPQFQDGKKVVLSYRNAEGIEPEFRYSYADNDRRLPIVLLVVLFVGAVLLFGALRGMLAIAGLLVSLLIIIFYVLPALVAGGNGLIIALTGGTLVAAAALYLAHGINYTTHIAFLSSIGSVFSIAFLSTLFFELGNFTGFVSEEAQFLSVGDANIDLRGLLVAGVILASLGALDDMTVTQVAAVSELHKARPDYRFKKLWDSALRIGRDHVAAVVNTLALAYVGTSLALMMLFVLSEQNIIWVLNSEAVAAQLVGALVGSIGLIVSVPLSTAISAFVVDRSDESLCTDHDHDHDEDEDVSQDNSSAGSEIK